MTAFINHNRQRLVVLLHLLLILVANYAAFWLRFDGQIGAADRAIMLRMLAVVVAIRAVTFHRFKLYGGLWRYTGVWDLRNIVAAAAVSSVLCYVVIHIALGHSGYPRSVFIVDALVLVCLLAGVRMMPRLWQEFMRPVKARRVLIIGAGDAGEMIVRDMRRYQEYRPVGFIDDDPRKQGQWIHGVRVLGGQAELPVVMARERPDEVLVAIARTNPATVRGVVRVLEPFRVPITTVPPLREMIHGQVSLEQIRRLSIEDLLARAPVGLDPGRIRQLIAGKRVLVTGAGGSIGSELSRQVAALSPAALVLYERYENSLYTITNDLTDRFPALNLRSVIGDVTDVNRLDTVLAEEQPHVIFHAAAHKHVPLMELNCCEAVKNNVSGTRRVAEAAARHGVDRFVLISSDKAVNPSSVMGTTKRLAELIVQRMGQQSDTRFMTVRFGNVLGSNGSVVPRFLEQIKGGGPVTVTHPEMRRYFMLIQEAVQLVLHAAAIGMGGELYVLDMGEQIKLVDMARNLIRLSGLVPDEQIPITFVGLRPGEKLSEELIGEGEAIRASEVQKVLQVSSRVHLDPLSFGDQLARLAAHAERNEFTTVLHLLSVMVPSYRPGLDLLTLALPAHALPDRRPVLTPIAPRVMLPPWRGVERREGAPSDRRLHYRGGRRFTDYPDWQLYAKVSEPDAVVV